MTAPGRKKRRECQHRKAVRVLWSSCREPGWYCESCERRLWFTTVKPNMRKASK